MEKSQYNSRWDIMLSLFADKDDFFKKQFLTYENELKTVQQINRCSGLRETFSSWLKTLVEVKTTKNSSIIRDNGNKALKEKNLSQALSFYTEAIYEADNDLETSLAHANRAYVLMLMKFYQEAFDDCEYALTNIQYPKDKKSKVILRQADCAIFQNNNENLKICLKRLEEMNLTEDSSLKLSKKLSELKEKLGNYSQFQKDETKIINPEKKQILCNTTSKGNFIVAGEKILQHEEIMTETAFAFVPLFNDKNCNAIDFNCQNCAESNIIPFPCDKCKKISYCSLKCSNLHKPIHIIECWGYKRNLYCDIGVAYLALRTLIVGFYDLLFYLDKEINANSCKELWNCILNCSMECKVPYAKIIALSSNIDKININDNLRYVLTASMLTTYLKDFTMFFNKTNHLINIKMSLDNWEAVTSALLFRHICQMVCNAHCITGMQLKKDIMNFWKCKDIPNIGTLHYFKPCKLFAAIYSRMSLYNHSCEPSFYNCFNKSNLIIKAAKDLKEKDEIFNSYGINFKTMGKLNRKMSLKAQYAFDCDCKHCNGEDSVFADFHTYICTNVNCKKKFHPNINDFYWWREPKENFKFKCSFCGTNFNWEWYQQFDAIRCSLSEGNSNKTKWFFLLYDQYEKSKNFLFESHELKQKMAAIILDEFISIPYESSRNRIMLKIARDLLNAIKEQYGVNNLEFIYGATYFLDLLALQINKGDDPGHYDDMTIISKSFDILPVKEKIIFQSYIKTYIKEN